MNPIEAKVTSLSSDKIKAEALRLGFSACGIAPAEAVDETTAHLFRQWLAEGKQAEMNYMANYEEKRLDPRLLMEGTQSIISVALNYYPETFIAPDEYQFAWYAYGKDYHEVMKEKLAALEAFVHQLISPLPVRSRIFCDTAPVLERYWAWRAGMGWIGKNTQLIVPRAGSCFFLGEIFIDLATDHYDHPQDNRCGSCTRCLKACPTQALEAPFRLHSGRCLSYLTIEHRGAFPASNELKTGNKIYGCDDCLKACPWNRFSTPCTTTELHPSPALLAMRQSHWHALTEEQYKALFKGSAVKRAKYNGLMRNIAQAADKQPE